MYSFDELKAVDAEIADAIAAEEERQNSHIELIASENWVSRAVMAAMGSVLTNKYAEGYPGKRYYGGCECVDVVEELARERAKKLFGCDYVNVQIFSLIFFFCPACGYTALGRFFDTVTQVQKKNIKEKICANFTAKIEPKSVYSYDEALWRYRMALANAIAKGTRASEKAYICLKTAWLLRSKAEHLEAGLPDCEAQKQQCGAKEEEMLRGALDGFIEARASEDYPMCGMDEPTVDYLIAALAFRFERYDVASRLVVEVLHSADNPRMKDRARDLKALVAVKMKEQKEEE